MTAPDEKAREIAVRWRNGRPPITDKSFSALVDAITAALIEARRAALEDGIKAVRREYLQDRTEDDADLAYDAAITDAIYALTALIPTRPDGAAELFAENAKKEGGQ